MSDAVKIGLIGLWVAFWLGVFAWTFTDSGKRELTQGTHPYRGEE